jgi:SOS-response transcriptional repressor LexA
MAPIVSTGAYVAFSDVEESAADLDGELVVAWMDGQSVVRWFENSGRYGVLRSENPGKEPGTILVELEALPPGERPRRVLWISTPH